MSYELIEHTADVGLRVRAADLDTLFAEAGAGLVALIVPNAAETSQPSPDAEPLTIELASDSLPALMCDWLNELVFLFETRQLVFDGFEVTVDAQRCALNARAAGQPLDPARHKLGYEIKAVTYHQLRVEPENNAWIAEVIVDI